MRKKVYVVDRRPLRVAGGEVLAPGTVVEDAENWTRVDSYVRSGALRVEERLV